MVSFCGLGDVTKPNLNWENEADVCKSNNRGMILFLVFFFGAVGVAFLLVKFEPAGSVMLVIGLAALAAAIAGAALCYQSLMKAADELPTRY